MMKEQWTQIDQCFTDLLVRPDPNVVEAFYRDALPKARTLEDAFNQAKAAIALR
jgi:hypothetical protein